MMLPYQPLSPSQACALESKEDHWECRRCGTKIRRSLVSAGVPFLVCRKPEFSSADVLPVQESAGESWKRVDRVDRSAGGVGTELTKLLHKIGITHKPGCQCGSRAALLDKMTPEQVAEKTDTVVGWMREEANRRGLPFLDLPARLLVKRAIRNARKSQKPPLTE